MKMNPYDHRMITFNGESLPEEIMAVSIIENFIDMPEDIADWLWRFPICCGVAKTASSSETIRVVGLARDLLLEHRFEMIKGISERFPMYQAEDVYHKWMQGMTRMIELSKDRDPCEWMAPSLATDPNKTAQDAARFLECLDKAATEIQKND